MAEAKVIAFLAPVGTSATERPARASATSPASRSTSTSSWAATALSSTPAFTGEHQPDKLHRYLAELPRASAPAASPRRAS